MTATATATILYEFDSGHGQVAVARLDPPLRSDEALRRAGYEVLR